MVTQQARIDLEQDRRARRIPVKSEAWASILRQAFPSDTVFPGRQRA
jgi:hypothetical protein